jgi:glyoxylase-like metal-dependent hydrolase (beta-lactamase superfamily II)
MATKTQEISRSTKMFKTDQGARIYQIPLEAFPDFWMFAYLVFVDDYLVLIDTGSNYIQSNENLDGGFQFVGEKEGKTIGYEDLTHIFITHGHIDHFGGLAYLKPKTNAKIGVHSLDWRNLTNYEERLVIVAKRLDQYLLESGVLPDKAKDMHDMYMLSKSLYHSVDIDFTHDEVGMRVGPFEMLHVPGHSAGIVIIRLHDVLFSGDHVLSRISPHQSPESLSLNTGLGHYLLSLQAAKDWAGDVRLTLGGHNSPIEDLAGRIDEIRTEHAERLNKIMEMFADIHTIAEISAKLFGKVDGYNVLLAVEEAGAHVEYLYQRGLLGIDNLEKIEQREAIVPVQYHRLDADVKFDINNI